MVFFLLNSLIKILTDKCRAPKSLLTLKISRGSARLNAGVLSVSLFITFFKILAPESDNLLCLKIHFTLTLTSSNSNQKF